jgi:hypothetical protein
MRISRVGSWVASVAIVLTGSSSISLAQSNCTFMIGVAPDGSFLTDRFHGWYKTNPKLMEKVLQTGCYPEGGPRPISFVTLELTPSAPKTKVELAYSILARNGWPKSKLRVKVWKNYPDKPTD